LFAFLVLLEMLDFFSFLVYDTNKLTKFRYSEWRRMTMMPFKEMARLDKLVHEPARLAVLSALDACTMAEFLFLQELTGLTKGNLSSHLSKLERAGLLIIEKQFVRKKIPHTTIRITREGRAAISNYWNHLDRIREVTNQWHKKT
jgi:DNA-binding transcriptional ArsR family regulator